MHIFNKNNTIYLIDNYLYTLTVDELTTDYWSKIIFLLFKYLVNNNNNNGGERKYI